MPVYNYKTFEEAEKLLEMLQRADPLERLRRLHSIVKTLKPPKKFNSVFSDSIRCKRRMNIEKM